jgi:hypothetical protein
MRVLPTTCLALLLAVPGAATSGEAASLQIMQPIAAPIVQQRIDVEEVSKPQPPSGPATPHPFCTPGDPICP